jgi:sugar phosphate isomerase/epimerase
LANVNRKDLKMAKEGEYTINEPYAGGKSSLDPPTGYRIGAGEFGLTTDPRTANILKEVSSKLSTGVKQVELALVSPQIFESVPNEQLKEINRLSKLTGINVSVHAPVVDPSGFANREFNEDNRKAIERQMIQAIERSHEINPDGSSPVTFHSSQELPGQIKQKGEKEPAGVYVVESDTGKFAGVLPIKKGNYPGEGEVNAKKELEHLNEKQWEQKKTEISHYAGMAEEAIANIGPIKVIANLKKKKGEELLPQEKQALYSFNRGKNFLENSYMGIKDLFETASSHATPEVQKVLDEFKKEIEQDAIKIKKNPDSEENLEIMREIIEKGIDTMNSLPAPQIYKPLYDIALQKTTETFANVALHSYKKFKDKAPIISIENPPAGGGFSTGEELKKIVEESRKKFVEKAVAEGMGESEAKSQAEKLLGVTWDVGHINMMKRFGYTNEDIIKESENVAPLVKHVHMSDNFGFEHTELPMGMGNVPIKEIMQKLGQKGFEAKKIIEAANWWQHMQTPPVQETLEAFGSPLYSMKMAPYWNSSAEQQQGYFSGVGAIYPSVHYETFGAGFSQLPMELGGQFGGAGKGRMGGGGME